ncbi:MAG: hypothetical protein OEV74_03175 [Cyclobacteriaceae bacterium]|nr:hypothetical protein [Cyclobacteriaceae bacterium]MDH4295257.1 hypothetical protein [Cyclobacteriaceae bacterium]MDH5249376.1 hypothetical protein [Cyclobacteriaceae bacterium]
MKSQFLSFIVGLIVGMGAIISFNMLIKPKKQSLEILPFPYYRVLFEDDNVRIIDHKLNPGETEPMHYHPPMYVYFLENADVVVSGPDGEKNSESLKKWQGSVFPALTHSIQNVGKTSLHSILIELK